MNDIAGTDIRSMEAIDPDTLILIISPVHGFNYPKITLDFIRAFPKGENQVVLMNTRAGMCIGRWVTPGLTGIAFLLSSLLLIWKGYSIVGQIPFDMPSNWISIHPALREKSVKRICETIHQRVEKHAAILFEGGKDFLACRDLLQDILILPVALAYYLVGRFVLAKSFYATSACNQCRLCEKQCPVHAIKHSTTDRPFWTFRCESCMRCMNHCPQRAIETTHGLWVTLGICSSMLSGFLCALLAPFIQSAFIKFIIFNIVLLLLLWVCYRIQYLLLKNRLIGKCIAFTSLTYYKFWGRYKLRS